MRIFLTGSTGYIGESLTTKLLQDGHTLHAVVRNLHKRALADHPNIKYFEGDLSDQRILNAAMEGCEAAFHLAAYARVWAKNPEIYFKINVEGTKNILDAALNSGVKKIIYTSTAGIIGPSYDQPSSEETTRRIDYFNEYESSKAMSEILLNEYLLKGLDTVVVYPSRVYGPGLMTDSNAVTKLIEQYIKGKWRLIPGDGSKTGSYAYIDDVVEGHKQAMLAGKPGGRYILGGENKNYNELFEIIRTITGKRHRLIKVPVAAMQAFGHLQMLKKSFTGKPPILTPAWIRKYEYDWSLSSQRAIEELNYTVTPFEDGVRQTISWLKAQNIIDGK